MKMIRKIFSSLLAVAILFTGTMGRSAHAAPKAELWSHWTANALTSKVRIDHTPWQRFLEKYLIRSDSSDVNLVRYGDVGPQDRDLLRAYLADLQKVQVAKLNRLEQMAYWINLYNSLTVKIVLNYYPVKSIRDIDISPGLFARGPWGAKLLQIEGQEVSLDDIEHRILRPIWKDNRIHYAVNCASIGCPNLQPEAFTADNLQRLLDRGAREYIHSDRGVKIERNKLTLSSIYKWFQDDFGGSEQLVLRHLSTYAEPFLANALTRYRGRISYQYDWRLNDASGRH